MTLSLAGFRGFPEPNYTKTPNLIFDAFLKDLTGSQLKALLYIVRRTMGWHKDGEFVPVSVAQVQEATGLSKEVAVEALRALDEGRLIMRRKQRGPGGQAAVSEYRLRFESDIDDEFDLKPRSENPTLAEDPSDSLVPKVGKPDLGGSENPTLVLTPNSTSVSGLAGNPQAPKETLIKENYFIPLIVPQENPLEHNTSPEIDTDEDVIAFVQRAYRLENRRAKLLNLRSRQAEPIIEKVRRADIEWGAFEFRSALIAYLNDTSDWLREHHWPIQTLLSQVQRYLPDAPPPRTAAAAPENGYTPPQLSNLPAAAQQWNEIVTAGPAVESWSARHDRALEATLTDPEFQAALPKVLALCQKAFEVQADEVSWLNFRYLLRTNKAGIPNWHRMASGEFNWLRKKRGGPQSKVDEAKAAIAQILGE